MNNDLKGELYNKSAINYVIEGVSTFCEAKPIINNFSKNAPDAQVYVSGSEKLAHGIKEHLISIGYNECLIVGDRI